MSPPCPLFFRPCTLWPSLPIPAPSLFPGCNIHFTSRPAHPICTLTILRHLCCSYNAYTILNVQYTPRTHPCADTPTPYPTVPHSQSLAFPAPSRSVLSFHPFPFLSLSFILPFVLYLPYLYTMLSAFHSVVFHSSLCSRFCHPSFDLCSLTLFHSRSFLVPRHLLPRDHLESRQCRFSEAQE
ncbi:hypothetical protein EDB92DRAFT_1356881 [Lactarius akahatsu]|uniref:Uncharacterized protein n=1 Tax=Lactarius akahatsu TaxID=416441 RepID=A0AAD4LAI0_9AGAM|nr:hypothetical protein EDB92DRAFT_1356881 [Lactarius akahatsu]